MLEVKLNMLNDNKLLHKNASDRHTSHRLFRIQSYVTINSNHFLFWKGFNKRTVLNYFPTNVSTSIFSYLASCAYNFPEHNIYKIVLLKFLIRCSKSSKTPSMIFGKKSSMTPITLIRLCSCSNHFPITH